MDVAPKDFISSIAAISPGKPALIFKDQVLTYKELDEKINVASQIFKKQGVTKGSVLAFLYGNSFEFWIGFFAAIKQGAVVFPVFPKLSLPEIQFLLRQIKPDFLFLDSSKTPLEKDFLAGLVGQAFSFKVTENLDLEITELIREENFISPLFNPAGNNLLLMTSSGTTGRPKLMFLDEEYVYNMTFAALEGFQTDENHVSLSLAPPQHFIGIVLPLSAWRQRTTVVLVDEVVPDYVLKTIEKHQVVLTVATPFVLSILADVFNSNFNISSLKKCISGGSPLSKKIYDTFTSKTKLPLHQGYGSIEAGLVATKLDDGQFEENFGGSVSRLSKVKIFSDGHQELDTGEVGIIAVSGPVVIKGYVGDPALNTKVFVGDYILTGDRGYLDNSGKLYILGRSDDVINIAGKKVDPVEVENVLNSFPGVKESAIFGFSDNENTFIKALLVTSADTDLTQLQQFCHDNLSSHKVPKIFKVVHSLPKDKLGKTIRKQLPEL